MRMIETLFTNVRIINMTDIQLLLMPIILGIILVTLLINKVNVRNKSRENVHQSTEFFREHREDNKYK
jgi:hypothetical protein